MKRVLTMQDISCLGKCSITVALPVISAMGLETTILPTALLSTHTMFKDFTFKDLTDQLVPITDHWKSQDVKFDTIYTGYLGSMEEIQIAKKIIKEFKTKDTLVFVDPVMGDNGKLYPNFDEEYARENATLCAYADVIVPNITEACLLTGMPYKEKYDESYVIELIERLSTFGSDVIVLTGVSLSEGKTGVYGYNKKTEEYFMYQNDKVDAVFHGTGDIFASVSVGALTRGFSLDEAFSLAADYTALTIEATKDDPKRPWYGVNFESTLPELIKRIED